jgi:hypothetical protein
VKEIPGAFREEDPVMRVESLQHWALLLGGILLLSVALLPSEWPSFGRAAWSLLQGFVAH